MQIPKCTVRKKAQAMTIDNEIKQHNSGDMECGRYRWPLGEMGLSSGSAEGYMLPRIVMEELHVSSG